MSKQLAVLCLMWPVMAIAQNIDGLVARYSFNNGTAKNHIGSDHAKVVGATLAEDRFGNPENAYYLHGSYESYLNLGTNPELKPTRGSISMWFKMENIIYSGKGYLANPLILTKSHDGNDFFEGYAIGIELSSRKLGIGSALSELSQVSFRTGHPVALGKWYHVVMAYDDDYLYLYLNGKFEGKMGKHFRTQFLAGDSVMVGNSANSKNKRFFNGYVDDIDIYDRVLTAEEVKTLYEAPNPNRFYEILKLLILVVASILGVLLLVWLVTKRYKKELEKEKEKNKLLRKVHEMQMQVIKAQMNPHFIFNAMNSVQEFILAGDNESAHKYLGKFSRLLRKILEGNQDVFTTLEDEIDMLTRYIEIESLRFKQTFKYEISTDAGMKTSSIRIPQMLIQPVVENAIWHGLLPKRESGMLNIRFEHLQEQVLLCTVDDDGVGRRPGKSREINLPKKSMAIAFICQRLELMKQEWGGDYAMSILDKVNAHGDRCGTRVIIKMPIFN